MVGRRESYTKETRARAVKLVLEEGLTREQVSKRMGMTPSAISAWIRDYRRERDNEKNGQDNE